jgi:hypothetical protein
MGLALHGSWSQTAMIRSRRAQSAPLPCSGGGTLADEDPRRPRSGQAGYAGLADWPTALSSLQLGAQLNGPAGGAAHPPFRSLGTPRCAGKCSELSSPALLLGLRQLRALPFLGELVGRIGR